MGIRARHFCSLVSVSSARYSLELCSAAYAAISVSFPSRFMLAAARNPCPCGFFGDATPECHCSPPPKLRYVSNISGPLLDRIDIDIELPAVEYKELRGDTEIESPASVRERVLRAPEFQAERYKVEKGL
jgi:magnesium chelatase family protein